MSQAVIGLMGDHQQDAKSRSKQAIERFFTPEFRNRLDAVVTFRSLTPEVMETIVDKFVLELETPASGAKGRHRAGAGGPKAPGREGL